MSDRKFSAAARDQCRLVVDPLDFDAELDEAFDHALRIIGFKKSFKAGSSIVQSGQKQRTIRNGFAAGKMYGPAGFNNRTHDKTVDFLIRLIEH